MTDNSINRTLKAYISLTKPGIIRGNIVVAAAGFFLASKTHIDVPLLFALIIGTSLIIASACVSNNYTDQVIDKKMARTKNRALVTGLISGKHALLFAAVLGFIGAAVLLSFTNVLTALIGAVGFIDYVFLYKVFKRRSVYGTIVGSISGATPPVAGYCAVTGKLDTTAAILFIILVTWQMAHFFAIAIYRHDDYKAASIPVLSVVRGTKSAKEQILAYVAAFSLSTLALYFIGIVGKPYFVLMLLTNTAWLFLGLKGYKTQKADRWARKMFFFSLVTLMLFSILISTDAIFG